MQSGYVIDEANPHGKFKNDDFYDSEESAKTQVDTASTDLRVTPENYEPGRYQFTIRQASKLDDGTIERLEIVSRHIVIVGPYSGAQ